MATSVVNIHEVDDKLIISADVGYDILDNDRINGKKALVDQYSVANLVIDTIDANDLFTIVGGDWVFDDYTITQGGQITGLDHLAAGESLVISFNYSAMVDDTRIDKNDPNQQVGEVLITVNGVNDAPVIGAGAPTCVCVDPMVGTVAAVPATDLDGDTLSYSLTGVDAALLSVDASGNISFNNTVNFANPSDNGADGIYDVTVIASDGFLTDSHALQIKLAADRPAQLVPSAVGLNNTALTSAGYVVNGFECDDVIGMVLTGGTGTFQGSSLTNAVLSNTVSLIGNGGDDTLSLNANGSVVISNTFYMDGGDGNDVLNLSASASSLVIFNQVTLLGGGGVDTLLVDLTGTGSAGGVGFANILMDGGSGSDDDVLMLNLIGGLHFLNAAELIGQGGDDTLVVNVSGSTIFGDFISLDGGSGNDIIDVNHNVVGSSLKLLFWNVDGGSGADTISLSGNFPSNNLIRLQYDSTGDLGSVADSVVGTLTNGQFNFQFSRGGGFLGDADNNGALDGTLVTNVNWTYTTTNQVLFYDADGAGAGSAIAVADFTNLNTLSAGDISFVA